MPDVVHGTERRALVPGRLLFDEAAELSVVVPASCKRTGRCHECVVEVRAGADQLTPPTAAESFLRPGVPARLPGARRARRSRRRLRRSSAAGSGSSSRPSCRARSRTSTRACVSSTAGTSASRSRGPAPRRTAWPTPTPSSGRRTPRTSARRSVPPVGLALDVGTTTVVLELVDLERGTVLAVAAFENPQRFGGSDVMTRISYEDDEPGMLRQALRRAVNHELHRLQADLSIDRRRIVEAVVVGNPTMRDLAFGLDVGPIGRIPYRSVTETARARGREPVDGRSSVARTSSGCSSTRAPASSAGRSSRATSARTRPRTSSRWTPSSAAARSCSSTSAPTPRSSSRTAGTSSPRPARPAPRSRAAACATGCPARTGRSRPCASTRPRGASTSGRSAAASPRGSAGPASWTCSPSCGARTG